MLEWWHTAWQRQHSLVTEAPALKAITLSSKLQSCQVIQGAAAGLTTILLIRHAPY